MKDPGYCMCSDCKKCRDNPGISCPRTILMVEIARLEKLAYIGEHHFEDVTYKHRLKEVVAERDRLKEVIAEWEKISDYNLEKINEQQLEIHKLKAQKETGCDHD